MTQRDPHRCAFEARCTRRELLEDGHVGAQIVDGVVCDGCLTKLRYAVKGIPADWERLHHGMGERFIAGGAKVSGTHEHALVINEHREALQAHIVDLADRAAEMVETAMNINGRQRHGRRGFPAHDKATVVHAVKILEPNLDVLLAQKEQDMLVWGRIPDGDEGWHPQNGQPRELQSFDGVDIAMQIVHASRLVYQELGRAALRHSDPMPCPAVNHKGEQCGAYTVGRWDGTAEYDCTTCGARWPEREYQWLQGLVIDLIKEQEETDLLKFLLAEAYSRLDEISALVKKAEVDPAIDLPGAGRVVAESIQDVLNNGLIPHQTPKERQTVKGPKK